MISTLSVRFKLVWARNLTKPLISADVSGCTGTHKCVLANHFNLITVSLWQATENQSQMKSGCGELRTLIHRDVTRIIVQKTGKKGTEAGKYNLIDWVNLA